jgi:hypothetical protein
MASVNGQQISNYLAKYVQAYREEYENFVAAPPNGGGYPRLAVSPFLYSRNLLCFVAKNGYVLGFTIIRA